MTILGMPREALLRVRRLAWPEPESSSIAPWAVAIGLAVGWFGTHPEAALACSCPPLTVQQQADAVEVVFTGRVVALSYTADALHAEFEVDRIWKGALSTTKHVVTDDCHVPFELERSYAVFGVFSRGLPRGSPIARGALALRTNWCRGTERVEFVSLASLGPGLDPRAFGARAYLPGLAAFTRTVPTALRNPSGDG